MSAEHMEGRAAPKPKEGSGKPAEPTLDASLVQHGASTLAGLTTGNLFSVRYRTREDLRGELRRRNRGLAAKGLRILPLRYGESKVLLYLYRPSLLKRDLEDAEAKRLLAELGYVGATPEEHLLRLIGRLSEASGFPHEIGLFLGYPPEDVRGFIENKADNYKCVGLWKVYGDVQRAQQRFSQIRKCTDLYQRLWTNAASLERLLVVV
ncbi:MAG: DUF3793 family protein [Lachnospiraceae bacterium]|nr:DUF3793 family protein [Lachnospiraceae bacterium]